jgi:hypothetical protein
MVANMQYIAVVLYLAWCLIGSLSGALLSRCGERRTSQPC